MADGSWVVLGCGAAASAILWLYSRVQRRAKMQRFIRAFRDLQQLLVSGAEFVEVTDTDKEPLFTRIAQAQTDEVARHAVKLGDVVMRRSEVIVGALRVFVDEARTTLIYLFALESGTEISLESYTEDSEFQTRIGSPFPWVRPPFYFVQNLSTTRPVAELLVAHHEFLRGISHAPLLRFVNTANAIRAWLNLRNREIAWRADQPPDELLERDVQMMFGPKYKKIWPRLRTKLRAPIPRAEARKQPSGRK